MASVVGGPCCRANSTGTNNQARERRLEARDWFVSPLHPLQDTWERFGYRPGACPAAEVLICQSPRVKEAIFLKEN